MDISGIRAAVLVVSVALAFSSGISHAARKEIGELEKEIYSELSRFQDPAQGKGKILLRKHSDLPEEGYLIGLRRLKDTLKRIQFPRPINRPGMIEIIFAPGMKNSGAYATGLIELRVEDPTSAWIGGFSAKAELEPNLTPQEMISIQLSSFREGLESVKGWASPSASEKLDHTPYSGSYLPIAQGRLLMKPVGNDLELGGMKKNIVEARQESSPILRLDRIRRAKNPSLPSLFNQRNFDRAYRFGAERWEGLCEQWSASSLDPRINQFLDETQGVVCDGVVLSQGELEELFTFFYSGFDGLFLEGERDNRNRSAAQLRMEDELGWSDVNPSKFQKAVHQALREKKGLVLDATPDEQVWNQPVYFSALQESVSAPKLDKIAPFVPANLLEGEGEQERTKLQEYLALEDQLRGWYEIEKERTTDPKATRAKALYSLKSALRSGDPERLLDQRAKYLAEFLEPAIKSGKVRLKEGVQARMYRHSVEYKGEDAFGLHSNANAYSAIGDYRFLTFEKGGAELAASWINRVYSRPDFAWQPVRRGPKKPGENQPGNDDDSVIQDLLELKKHCLNLSEVFRFYRDFSNAISDRKVSAAEKEELLTQYRTVKDVIRFEQLEQALKDKLPEGLSVEDLRFLNQ